MSSIYIYFYIWYKMTQLILESSENYIHIRNPIQSRSSRLSQNHSVWQTSFSVPILVWVDQKSSKILIKLIVFTPQIIINLLLLRWPMDDLYLVSPSSGPSWPLSIIPLFLVIEINIGISNGFVLRWWFINQILPACSISHNQSYYDRNVKVLAFHGIYLLFVNSHKDWFAPTHQYKTVTFLP